MIEKSLYANSQYFHLLLWFDSTDLKSQSFIYISFIMFSSCLPNNQSYLWFSLLDGFLILVQKTPNNKSSHGGFHYGIVPFSWVHSVSRSRVDYVTMVTVAILIIPKPNFISTHGSHHFFKVSFSSELFLFIFTFLLFPW